MNSLDFCCNGSSWWYWYFGLGKSNGLAFHTYFCYFENLDDEEMTLNSNVSQFIISVASWIENCFKFIALIKSRYDVPFFSGLRVLTHTHTRYYD